MTESTAETFGDILAAYVRRRESQIVVGLDPDPNALWLDRRPTGEGDREQDPLGAVARAVLGHCRAVLDAVAPACVAVKLQLACFERLGGRGWTAMETVVEHAHSLGLLVIADGKRGDIAISASAYGQALLGGSELGGLGADLVTVNPLMGRDSLAPFVAIARERARGVLVLVRTSNPGGADVQDLSLEGGTRVWEHLASLVHELGRSGLGESGLSDVGAVVGATVPGHLRRARELMPDAIFLLPGVGAQGGRVQELAAAFVPGRAGGLITASRSIVAAHHDTGADPALAARAEAERLRAAAWALAE